MQCEKNVYTGIDRVHICYNIVMKCKNMSNFMLHPGYIGHSDSIIRKTDIRYSNNNNR